MNTSTAALAVSSQPARRPVAPAGDTIPGEGWGGTQNITSITPLGPTPGQSAQQNPAVRTAQNAAYARGDSASALTAALKRHYQAALNAAGARDAHGRALGVDGVIGANTLAAVRDFQSRVYPEHTRTRGYKPSPIAVTGTLNAQTQAALENYGVGAVSAQQTTITTPGSQQAPPAPAPPAPAPPPAQAQPPAVRPPPTAAPPAAQPQGQAALSSSEVPWVPVVAVGTGALAVTLAFLYRKQIAKALRR